MAIVMTKPGHVETQELPWPKLERGALIHKMEMAGICGTDKHAYQGETILCDCSTEIKGRLDHGLRAPI